MRARRPVHNANTALLVGMLLAAFVICGLFILGVFPTGRAG